MSTSTAPPTDEPQHKPPTGRSSSRSSDEYSDSGSDGMEMDTEDLESDMEMEMGPPSPPADGPPSPTSTDYIDDRNIEELPPRPGSQASLYSVTPSLQDSAFTELFGRRVNNMGGIYSFPADNSEYARQIMQQETIVQIMGGNEYLPEIEDVLRERYPGEERQCLDLGYGSGVWMIKAANKWTNVQFVGVDLVPLDNPDSLPSNCRIEVDDLNFGLQHFYNQFHMVRCQLVSFGIADFYGLVEEISKCLVPGGLVVLADTDLIAYDHRQIPYQFDIKDFREPFWPRYLSLVKEATSALGGTSGAGPDLYDHLVKTGAFNGLIFREHWIAGSAWRERYDLVQNDKHTLDDGLAYIDSSRVLLLRRGHDAEKIDALAAKAKQELIEARIPCYARLYTVTAWKS